MFLSTPCSGRGASRLRGGGGGEERGEKVEEGGEGRRKEGGRVLTPSAVPFSVQCWSLQQATQKRREVYEKSFKRE